MSDIAPRRSVTGFVEAESLGAAVEILAEDPGAARVIGGGTGLMLMSRAGLLSVDTLVSLSRVTDHDLHAVTVTDQSLWIGGLCTLSSIERHPGVREVFPVIAQVLARLSSPRTRNVATIAGCVVHGDPHMDLPPALLALEASVMVEGRGGRRRIPSSDFYLGYYDVALEPDEVMVGVEIPRRADSTCRYRKFTGALVEDWPVVGVALRLECRAGRVRGAGVAVSAVEPACRRLPEVEEALMGAAVEDIDPRDVGSLAASSVDPSDDHLASAWYKRRILEVESCRAVRAWQREVLDARS